MDARSILGKY